MEATLLGMKNVTKTVKSGVLRLGPNAAALVAYNVVSFCPHTDIIK